jgi:hypothetical protein
VLFLDDSATGLGKLVNPVELHSLVPGPNHGNGSHHWQEGQRALCPTLQSLPFSCSWTR